MTFKIGIIFDSVWAYLPKALWYLALMAGRRASSSVFSCSPSATGSLLGCRSGGEAPDSAISVPAVPVKIVDKLGERVACIVFFSLSSATCFESGCKLDGVASDNGSNVPAVSFNIDAG